MHFALIQYFFSVDIRADSYRSTVKYKNTKPTFFIKKTTKICLLSRIVGGVEDDLIPINMELDFVHRLRTKV